MLRFVCLALIAVAADAGKKYGYGPSVALGSLGVGLGGPGLLGGAIGLGLGNVAGSINSLGGVNTFASGLQGATPAVRGAAQGAATGSALGISAGPASRVSGVAVGTGDGRAHVIGNVQPAVPYGVGLLGASGIYGTNVGLGGLGGIYGGNVGLGGLGGISLGRPDVATFRGNTFGNSASGVINSNLQGQIGYGSNGLIGRGGLYGLSGLNYLGLGGSSFVGTSQSLPYGNAVLSGQAVGAGVPLAGSVNFNNFGVGSGPLLGTGPIVGPSVVGPSVVGPSVVGPSVVGPSVVGPSVVGPSVVGPSVTIKKKVY